MLIGNILRLQCLRLLLLLAEIRLVEEIGEENGKRHVDAEAEEEVLERLLDDLEKIS